MVMNALQPRAGGNVSRDAGTVDVDEWILPINFYFLAIFNTLT